MGGDPDLAAAIPELVGAGTLSPELGARLLRPATGALLSVRRELRASLYLGVLAVTGGVSLLVRENLDRIGPAGVAVLIALAAAVALGWVLLAGGAAAIALALAMRRYLDGGQGHERHGLTAEALAGEPTAPGTLEVAATLLALAPAARPLPPSSEPHVRGEGGEFGGGGSSSSF